MPEALEKTQRMQWHPAFVGGFRISMLKYSDELEYVPEYQLAKSPLRTDLLVIRKNTDNIIDNDVARIFLRYNIIEYKNPDDSLSIDDLFKVLAYVCLYKASGETVNEIPGDKLTATIVRESKPIALFREIRRLGGTVEKTAEGVYHISGIISVPVQIVVSGGLAGDVFASLRILSKKPKEADIKTFLKQSSYFSKPGDKMDADAVLQVSISANEKLYEEVMRRDLAMCDALRKLMAAEIEAEKELAREDERKRVQAEADQKIKHLQAEAEEKEQSVLKMIKGVMYKLNYSADQAMDLLEISVKERKKYSSYL